MEKNIFTKRAIRGKKLTKDELYKVTKQMDFKEHCRKSKPFLEGIPMEQQCQHIPIDETFDLLKERMKGLGFNEIFIEDDDPEFKNFFAKSNQLFEDSFFCMQILLYELHWDDGTDAGMEFHALFFTQKGKKIQRSLSRNGFERLRIFLDGKIFDPCELKAVEYDPPDPSDRNYTRPKSYPTLFPGHVPGVEIHVGGWLCKRP